MRFALADGPLSNKGAHVLWSIHQTEEARRDIHDHQTAAAPDPCAAAGFIGLRLGICNDAVALLQANRHTEAADTFAGLGHDRDALQLAMYCHAVAAGEAGLYAAALALMDAGDYTGAWLLLANISGCRDASEQMARCAAMGAVTFRTMTGHIDPDCINSGYDYGIVSTLDTAFAASNEPVSSRVATRVFSSAQDATGMLCTLDIPVPDSGEHVIWIKYIRDSNGISCNDSLQFAVRFE